jgi:thioredoxin reductase
LRVVRNHLGPAPGYFMRDRVIGKVVVHNRVEAKQALPGDDGGVRLTLANGAGETRELQVDHVICGTGYKSELARLPFLDGALLSQIQAVEGTPILSANFESSAPGLYFIGAIAANSFGPMLRFACGAEFAAPCVARHLSRRRKSSARLTPTDSQAQATLRPAEPLSNLS